MLALPVSVQAQQLVIPSTTGTMACTEGGLGELAAVGTINLPTIINDTLPINIGSLTAAQFKTAFGFSTLPSGGAVLSMGVMPNAIGASNTTLPTNTVSLGTITDTQSSTAVNHTFTGLKKSTRYVFGLISDGKWLARGCFKTRGEFTNAEQNLVMSEGTWQPNLAQYNQTGCYAVASTRQDIRDCYCNGTRGGTHILAGQTAASQAQRTYLNCPDLDS